MDATVKEPVSKTGTSISAFQTGEADGASKARGPAAPAGRQDKPEGQEPLSQQTPPAGKKSLKDAVTGLLTAQTRRARIILGVVAVAFLAICFYGFQWLIVGRFVVETDDAYVQADVSTLGVKVAGYIAEVPVKNGDSVKAGDVVVRLDDTDYRTALDAAKARRATQTAAIERITRQIGAQHAAVDSARAGVASAQADVVRTLASFDRAQALSEREYGSKANLDQAISDRDRAAAALVNARASVAAADANLSVAVAQQSEAEQTAKELDVAVTKAQNDLDATLIRAPTDGIVGNRAAQPGQYAAPGTRLMALVPLKSIYISANFKETQLATLSPGQKATVHVDSINGESFEGVVGKTSPASGAVFSLLPPENATGNFTKIIQRVPVRIEVPAEIALGGKLLPGLSVIVKVDTRTSATK